jgi:hypothetical protein
VIESYNLRLGVRFPGCACGVVAPTELSCHLPKFQGPKANQKLFCGYPVVMIVHTRMKPQRRSFSYKAETVSVLGVKYGAKGHYSGKEVEVLQKVAEGVRWAKISTYWDFNEQLTV